MDLRLNGLSFGSGEDCGGEDYVEVDGVPFCDAVEVTSSRKNQTFPVVLQFPLNFQHFQMKSLSYPGKVRCPCD